MKETAVEWLFKQISTSKHFYNLMEDIQSRSTVAQSNIFEQAKEMEEIDLHLEYMKGWRDGYNNQESVTDDTL
jgi:hypothetical protein